MNNNEEIKKSIIAKARKLIALGLIEWDPSFSLTDRQAAQDFINGKNEGVYVAHPIPGYNTTTYVITKPGIGYECTCQGCQSKIRKGLYNPNVEDKAACSHILAVYLYNKDNKVQR